MMISGRDHIPVLREEVLSYLKVSPGGFYVDATTGAGGHALSILEALGAEGHLLAIDQDEGALRRARELLEPYQQQITFVQSNFRFLPDILQRFSFPSPHGILVDQGISSLQVDTPERGFSYGQDGPLDMRMDRRQTLRALDMVNTCSISELARIFSEYGEERWAERIASFIVQQRKEEDITRTLQLVEIIKGAIPARFRRRGPHPARRTFMALRIAVNDELAALQEFLGTAVPLLKKGGRLAVISFHSLEDRLVKRAFKELASDCICPPDLPVCCCEKEPLVEILTKRPVFPKPHEREENPRSRSARLRVVERCK